MKQALLILLVFSCKLAFGTFSNSRAEVLNKVPVTRTISINGTAQDLTADRSWSIATRVAQKAGTLTSAGVPFTDTFSLSTSTPTISMSSYISAQGGTKFKLSGVVGFRTGATATNAPNVAITGMTDNSVTCIITQQNTATITILGINVLSGLPMVLVPDPTNVKLIIDGIIY